MERPREQGFEVFLNLKFHDIPNIVAAAADLGVWMLNLHAAADVRMMVAARERLTPYRALPS